MRVHPWWSTSYSLRIPPLASALAASIFLTEKDLACREAGAVCMRGACGRVSRVRMVSTVSIGIIGSMGSIGNIGSIGSIRSTGSKASAVLRIVRVVSVVKCSKHGKRCLHVRSVRSVRSVQMIVVWLGIAQRYTNAARNLPRRARCSEGQGGEVQRGVE